MKYLGFFREIGPENLSVYAESIELAKRREVDYRKVEIIAYLESGHPLLDVMESCPDVLDSKLSIRGGSSVLTDGEWIWRWDLIHYVRRYDLGLQDDFVSYVRDNSYRVPEVSSGVLVALSSEVNNLLGFHSDPGAKPNRP